jgi:polyhydroxyalkanoate synthase subunit PhaC
MNTSYLQALNDAWTAQLAAAASWPSWYQPPASVHSAAELGDASLAFDPVQLARLHQDYLRELSALWQDAISGKTPSLSDKRFAASAWKSNATYAVNAAAYLLNARYLLSMVDALQTTPKLKQKIRFALQQTIDAMSPANFLASNPDAQKKLLDTSGESLAKGMRQMLADLRKGRISQTDESAFEIGRNVATTEGAVVFENELFQLLQYKPLSASVYRRPLLIVPPCINKFYILDLQANNSMVRYAVEQGHNVFMMSWRNPDASLAHVAWDDYVTRGVIEAIGVTQAISGEDRINAMGFCVGGTILAMALAMLFARGDKPVSSLTLLTTMLDYSDAGALEVFIDEASVMQREQQIGRSGLMPGRDFAAAFSSLRPNDLVWNYVESNYLKGEKPPAFDLLYWNADSTNLPGPMFCWYLRHLYLEDSLKIPGKLKVAGEKIDLRKISVPAFIFASREDHIVPWATAYASTGLVNRKKPANNEFVLGASGHIAGVINHPAKKRRSYWVNETPGDNRGPEQWLASASEHAGSWWPHWMQFLARHAGEKTDAPRHYGNDRFPPIEPAPGRYVRGFSAQ